MIRPHSLIEGHMIVMRWVKSITSQCWASPKTHLWAAVEGVGTMSSRSSHRCLQPSLSACWI